MGSNRQESYPSANLDYEMKPATPEVVADYRHSIFCRWSASQPTSTTPRLVGPSSVRRRWRLSAGWVSGAEQVLLASRHQPAALTKLLPDKIFRRLQEREMIRGYG